MVLPSLGRPQEEPGYWLWKARIGLGLRVRTGVVLGWRQCVVLYRLEVQMMRTSRGLVEALDI